MGIFLSAPAVSCPSTRQIQLQDCDDRVFGCPTRQIFAVRQPIRQFRAHNQPALDVGEFRSVIFIKQKNMITIEQFKTGLCCNTYFCLVFGAMLFFQSFNFCGRYEST